MAKRKHQQHIEGTGPEKIPKIINAAQDFNEARGEAKQATLKKNACEEKLIEAMMAHGLDHYTYGDITVKLKNKNSVGVRIKSAESDDSDEE